MVSRTAVLWRPDCVGHKCWRSGLMPLRHLAFLVASVVFLMNVCAVRAADDPASARDLLLPVIEALKAVEHPRSGRGSATVKVQDKQGYHEHLADFRFKEDQLSRTDWFDIQDERREKRQVAWSMGREVYVGSNESNAVVLREAAEQFHHECGYDFHPSTFTSPWHESLADTLQRWIDGPGDLSVNLDSDGQLQIKAEYQDIQGKDDDDVLRNIIVLDKAMGFRPVFFQHTWSYLKADKLSWGTQTRVSWMRHGRTWYVSDAEYKRFTVGSYVEGESPRIVDSSKWWVKVAVQGLTLDVDIPDSEFTLDGLGLPSRLLVADRVAGATYRYEGPTAAAAEPEKLSNERDSPERLVRGQNAGPWENSGKVAASLEGLQWIKGGPVEIEKDSIYIVEFWATWCGPCRVSIPHLTELQREFEEKGVTVIGISGETADVVRPFVEAKGDAMGYAVASDPDQQVSQRYMEAFKVGGIPHAFIVGRNGTILWDGHPMVRMDEVLREILADDFDEVANTEKKVAAEQIAHSAELQKRYFASVDRDTEEAAKTGQQFVTDGSDATLLNVFAWRVLTDVPEANRDLELALEGAAKAVRLSGEKDAAILDTYALALYELGKRHVGEAIVHQKKALALAENSWMREGLEKRLKRYESASVE
jgi:thiol-disulfide isomerase/thioredoxin